MLRAVGASLGAALALAGAADAGTIRVAVASLDEPEVAWNLDAHVRPDLCGAPQRAGPLRWRMRCSHAGAVAARLGKLPLRATARNGVVRIRTAFPWERLPHLLERVTVPSLERLRVVSRSSRRIVAQGHGLWLEFLRMTPRAAAAAFARGAVDVAPVPVGDLRAARADPRLRGAVRVRPLDAVDGIRFDLRGGALAGLPVTRRTYWLTADRGDYALLASDDAGAPAYGLLRGARKPTAGAVRAAKQRIGRLPPTRVRVAGDAELAAIPVSDWRDLGLGPVVDRSGADRFERLTALYPGPEGLFLALQGSPGPLLRQALGARDPLPALRRLDARLRAEASFVPLAQVVGARLVSPRLRGWRQDALGLVDYAAVHLRPK